MDQPQRGMGWKAPPRRPQQPRRKPPLGDGAVGAAASRPATASSLAAAATSAVLDPSDCSSQAGGVAVAPRMEAITCQ